MADAVGSIRKRIVDLMLARLLGDTDSPLPDYLGTVKISKNRSIPISAEEMPLYAVYFINDQPTPAGDTRRPSLVTRKLLIEARVIAKGNDDAADPHCQWIVARMVSADRCIDVDATQLAMSVAENETVFEPLEGAQSEVTVTRLRFLVEYRTLRDDLTRIP